MKIRNVVLVATVCALLTVSLNGISLTGDRSSNSSSEKTTALIKGSPSTSVPTMSKSDSSKTTDNAVSSSSPEPSPPSGQDTTPTPSQSPVTSPSAVDSSPLVTQVQNGVHSKLFPNQTEGTICLTCHTIQNSQYTLRQSGWETCGTCHVNSTGNPIPGVEVQHPQYQMIQGVAIGDILPMPSYKYKYLKDSFSCTNCHVTNGTKHDFRVPGVTALQDSKGSDSQGTSIDFQQFKGIFKQSSCDVCHPSTAETVNRVKEMQSIIGKKLDELQPIYEEWSTKVKSMDANDPKVLTFKNGATYYTYVYSDGSKGVHNFPYARLLLEKAELIWRGLQL